MALHPNSLNISSSWHLALAGRTETGSHGWSSLSQVTPQDLGSSPGKGGTDNHISRDLPQIGQLLQVREVSFEYAFSFTTFDASLFRPLLTVPVTFSPPPSLAGFVTSSRIRQEGVPHGLTQRLSLGMGNKFAFG